MDFSGFDDVSASLHICCIGTPEQVQGLQWSLNHRSHEGKNFRVYRAKLSDSVESFDDYNYIVIFLDMAQPVPAEIIRRISADKKGLVAFIQPTPGQLLALNQASDWGAISWDGAAYDEVAERLDGFIAKEERKIQNLAFISSAKRWIRKHFLEVDEIRIINPKDDWKMPTQRRLDPALGRLSVGCRDSRADMTLPFVGDEILFELNFLQGKWSVNVKAQDHIVKVSGDENELGAGDEIQVQDILFMLGRGTELEEFFGIARKLSILGESESTKVLEGRRNQFIESELAGRCRSLIYQQTTGELLVEDGHRSASIFFFSGVIIHCVTGAVSGLKALLRVLSWPSPRWDFVNWSVSKMPIDTMRLDLLSFSRAIEENQKTMERVRSFVPPAQLHMKIKPSEFLARKVWSIEENLVLAAVGEYPLAREILNFCRVPDSQIYETLIELRRQGILMLQQPSR